MQVHRGQETTQGQEHQSQGGSQAIFELVRPFVLK